MPPTIQPSGVSRQASAPLPIQAAPLHPFCESQNRLSLLFWLICQVIRRLLTIVELSFLACRAGSGRYDHAFGLPAF